MRRLQLTALVSLLLLSGACGSGDPVVDDSSGSTTTAGEAVAEVPPEIAEADQLTVGSDIAYPPVEFFEEGTQNAQGIDVDLCNAIAAKLALSKGCVFQNTTFDGIIPALTAKRFDIIMSALSDTAERQQTIDFVDYFNVGTSILVAKGNPENIQSLDDLCGHKVGLQAGTTQEEVAKEQAAKCKAEGKGELEVLTFETDTDAQQQLKAGRTVADMNDFPVAAYVAQTAGNGEDFEVVGEQIDAGPYGIGVRKEDTQLRDALKAALEAIVEDGTYAEILEKWNVSQGAVSEITINGGA
jgi:polar amino acid transport system substrate-binding protein